jgi:predicted GIY-YIG superfamily endonuclease
MTRAAVYRFFSGTGDILYIGMSSNPFMRAVVHKSSSDWYFDVKNMTIDWFESREVAAKKEAEAIRAEKPIHNIASTKTPKSMLPRPKTAVWLSPNEKQKIHLCTLWYSSLSPGHVLDRAKDVMGRPVSRAQMNRLCGPRDGSSRKVVK